MNTNAMPLEQHPYNGRVLETDVASGDRNYTVAIHLTQLANLTVVLFPYALFIPLILWLIRKDQSTFVDDHGRENINFTISFFLWHIILLVTFIGVILWPALWIVAIVSFIRGAIAGSRGEYFRYPMTFRFL